ncbi:DUF6585 family protein [Streptomyces sp. C]|uniref:DUF6585 family protein n=1 Tax=Streptomyces sp. C TaxID=253839 RepID=UPI0001DEEEC0|nr:DUF6585 family protein [Streptomyces sp. C]EFL12763.1 predicted protein [Streptomyces sp. C]
MATDEIAHIRREQPSPAAAQLAAQQGLGNWTDTIATSQGFRNRKWRDWRMFLFNGGLVVTSPDGYLAAYDWRTVRVLQFRRQDGFSCQALIDPQGNALNIGFGRIPLFQSAKAALGVSSWTNGAPFLYPNSWGDGIQDAVARAQLPGTLKRIEVGETVTFGPYSLNKDRVWDKEYGCSWSEIVEIFCQDGSFYLNGTQRRSQAPRSEVIERIPNLHLLMNVCIELSPKVTTFGKLGQQQ